jgi:hypothetical protein
MTVTVTVKGATPTDVPSHWRAQLVRVPGEQHGAWKIQKLERIGY